MAPTANSFLLAVSKEATEDSSKVETNIVLELCFYRICFFVDGR